MVERVALALALATIPAGFASAQDSPAEDGTQVLIAGEVSTSATLAAARDRVRGRYLELLKAAGEGTEPSLEPIVAPLRGDLVRLESTMATHMPAYERALGTAVDSMVAGADELVLRYATGESPEKVLQRLQLLEGAMRRIERLVADAQRDSVSPPAMESPPGWSTPAKLSEPNYRKRLVGADPRSLVKEARIQLDRLSRSKPERAARDAVACGELAEVARELAARAAVLRPSAQETFRDSALRIDVMAENAERLLREGNRSHLRRQLRAIEETLRGMEAQLSLDGW